MTMLSYDIALLALAAASTALILVTVVIIGDFQSQHPHAKAELPPQPH